MTRLLSVCALLAGAAIAQDAREIVRRSVAGDERYSRLVMQYTFLERQETRQFDAVGKVKERDVKTWEVIQLEGSQYRRPVSHNDKPLPAAEEEREQAKVRHNIETRKAETPEQRELRLAEARKRIERQRAPGRELPDAFDFRIVGEEKYEGQDVWVIEAQPKKGYRPKARGAFFFPKVKGKLWISKADFQWVKAEGESTDTITFGGILARVAKGATIRIEQTRVNDEVWLPKRIDISAVARLALVKLWRGRMEITYSNYRKFQASSRLVE